MTSRGSGNGGAEESQTGRCRPYYFSALFQTEAHADT